MGRRIWKESATSAATDAQKSWWIISGTSERQLTKGALQTQEFSDGKYEVAASLLESTAGKFAQSNR